MQRRVFVKAGLASTAGLVAGTPNSRSGIPAREAEDSVLKPPASGDWEINLFTKIVDRPQYGFSYDEIAALFSKVGVTGPNITVRSGGMVAPERVEDDLPRAVESFRKHGLSTSMITTELNSVEDPTSRQTLRTAAKLGIKYHQTGYYHHRDPARWKSELESARAGLDSLVSAGRGEGIQTLFYNHQGEIGGAIWETWELLEKLDADWSGCYFDISHAVVEGGVIGWVMGLHRLAPRIKALHVQDVVWEKVGGMWQTRRCPLGEGMVDWTRFFKIVSAVKFRGPFGLAVNYDPGGTSKADRFERSLAAAQHDVQFLKAQLKSTFGSATC
jgi:L-ribulose-5-phosphate 3-epimerase